MSKKSMPDLPTCPHCGGHRFTLIVEQMADVSFLQDDDAEVDDGPFGDMEWDGLTHATCLNGECVYSATLHDMKKGKAS